jgi:glycosyltransferase involved in cell wall biosynthesis
MSDVSPIYDVTKHKLVFVHGSLGMGGAEVLRLSVLEELVRRGANVEVVVLRKPGELAEKVQELGVPLTVLGNKGGLFDWKGVRKLSEWLKTNQPAIVQSSQFLTNFQTRLACRQAKVPVHIIEEHGIYTWKKWYHRFIDRQFNARAQAVIACSHQVAKFAAKSLGIAQDKIDVVHNCVAAIHLDGNEPTQDQRIRKRIELTGSNQNPRYVVGIVGTLRWEKGHRFLLEAWNQLHQSGFLNQDDYLVVVGDGPLRLKLEEQAVRIPNIRFVGSVSETRPILKSLDLFVLPSLNEGFGIAIIEAMAAGVPVVASKSGGIPEIIDSQELGRLVSSESAIELAGSIEGVLREDKLMKQLGTNGKSAVFKRFSPKTYVDSLIRIYHREVSGEQC